MCPSSHNKSRIASQYCLRALFIRSEQASLETEVGPYWGLPPPIRNTLVASACCRIALVLLRERTGQDDISVRIENLNQIPNRHIDNRVAVSAVQMQVTEAKSI